MLHVAGLEELLDRISRNDGHFVENVQQAVRQ